MSEPRDSRRDDDLCRLLVENEALRTALSRIDRAARKHSAEDAGWQFVFAELAALDDVVASVRRLRER